MSRRPVYTLEQIIDLFQLEVPLLRQKDLTKVRNTWCAYLGWDAVKKRAVRLYAPGRLTRAEAFEVIQPRLLAYLQGRLPAMIRLEAYARKWLATTTCMASTKANYVSMLNLHILPAFGGRLLKDITATDIRQYLVEKLAAGKLEPKSINDHLILMRSILKAAYEDEIINRNPASQVRRLPQMKTKVEAFNEEEVREILKTASEEWPRWHTPILHAFATGERAGEIWAHQPEDLRKEKIRVERAVRQGRVGNTKDHEQRDVEFPAALREAIANATAYHSPLRGPWLYTTEKGKRVEHGTFTKRVWTKIIRRAHARSLSNNGAGVRELNFHCSRHTFASLHLRHGTSLEWVSKQLGHYSLEFTFKTYVHFMPKADDGAADRLMAIIGR